MYLLVFGGNFLSSIKKLDKKLKVRIDGQLKLAQQNPFHPQLHSKSLHGKLGDFYSFRIGKNHRIVFKFLPNKTIQLLTIKHRREAYK